MVSSERERDPSLPSLCPVATSCARSRFKDGRRVMGPTDVADPARVSLVSHPGCLLVGSPWGGGVVVCHVIVSTAMPVIKVREASAGYLICLCRSWGKKNVKSIPGDGCNGVYLRCPSAPLSPSGRVAAIFPSFHTPTSCFLNRLWGARLCRCDSLGADAYGPAEYHQSIALML